VAGIVGEVAARIFGQTDPRTTEYAHTLGLAFQLTNIIRDVGEDAMRGRIYLPVNELQQFDVKAHEILKRQYSDRFTALMRFQAERAHRLYDEALALLPDADRRAQKPGLMMASIYRTLLREIEHENFQVLHQRIRLTPLRKFWLAWKVQALGRHCSFPTGRGCNCPICRRRWMPCWALPAPKAGIGVTSWRCCARPLAGSCAAFAAHRRLRWPSCAPRSHHA
jgi:hypothetical protein